MEINPEDSMVRTAVFGRQVEQFLEGDIGSYMLTLAKEQSEVWTRKLKSIDPYDAEHIMVAQMKIHVAELFINWLGDAVRAGLQATIHVQEDA